MHEKSHPAALLVTGPAASGEVSTLVTVTVVSADGTTVTPPTAIGAAAAVGATGADANRASPAVNGITTVEGRWTFGAPANASGDYPLLLNGSNAPDSANGGGFADLLQVTNGNLYARQKSGQYSVRWSAQWHATAAPPAEGITANAVALTVLLPKIPDSAPAGTVVATAHVTMSPVGAKFGGALVSSNPLFAARGTDIVLTRALSSTDAAAAVHATITAVQ
jgi:hypothetical protein